MLLCTSVTILAFLGFSRSQQRITQDDAESLLHTAARIKENIFDHLRQEETLNASCILEGIRDRKINVFHLERIRQGRSISQLSENLCGLQDDWLSDLHYVEEELTHGQLNSTSSRQKTIISSTCGNVPDAVATALVRGDLAASKKLITGLLSTIRYPISTPDVMTLFENAVKIIDTPTTTVEKFRVMGDDVIENLLLGILAQNQLQPHENYQILELVSTLDNIRPLKDLALLLLMKPDSYPRDVIEARDKLIVAMGYGAITGEPSPGWPTPPQQLLSLLTSLTNNPNDNEYVAYAHVLYAYFRMRYLTLMGYEFTPRSLADIAFLINSFLTVRHPILLREIYMEFTKIPWQTMTRDLDYTQYSDPRVLLTDMMKAILQHPDSLQFCNQIIFQYFINADSSPSWLQVLPDESEPRRPIEVVPGNFSRPPPPLSKCPGEDTPVIDPDCLIEILGSNTHTNFIIDLLRFNPATAEQYPYNTREAVYQALLNDIKVGKYKDDEVNQFIIEQAIARLPLNENKTLPPIYINMCPDEIEDLKACEPMNPPLEEKSSQYKTSPITLDEESNECTEDTLNCKKVAVINQQCLIDIISEPRTNAIKNLVLLKPILYSNYRHLDNREEILKKVLEDRDKELDDEIVHFIVPQAIQRMTISWQGTLPPIVEEICEEDFKYNVTMLEPEGNEETEELATSPRGCTVHKTIDPECLIEILSDRKNTKNIQSLILSEPILASEYSQYTTRAGLFKAVVIDRSEARKEWQLTYDVKKILAKVPFNWKQSLPIEYLDECQQSTTPHPETHFSPSDLFVNTIPGIGEKPIPCSSTTQVPETEDDDHTSEPSTETSSVINEESPTTRDDQTPEKLTESPVPTLGYKYDNDDPITDTPTEEDDEDCEESAVGVGVGVAELGASPDNYGQTLGDQVLDSILEAVKIPKTDSNKRCKPRKIVCTQGEVSTEVVKIESLWEALTPEAPKAPYIRSKVSAFTVPIERNKEYTKAEVLRDILLGVREEIHDPRVLQNVDQLIKCIRFEGPGIQPPETETECLPESELVSKHTTSAPLQCKPNEISVTVVQTESLYTALSPAAPKTPYIRNRVNSYIVPIDKSQIYTKGEVLRDILQSLKEETADQRIVHNINILLGFILFDGPGQEEPEVVDVCLLESSIADNSTHLPSPPLSSQLDSTPSIEVTTHSTIPDKKQPEDVVTDSSISSAAEPNKPAQPEAPFRPISSVAEPEKPIQPKTPFSPKHPSPSELGGNSSISSVAEPEKPIQPQAPLENNFPSPPGDSSISLVAEPDKPTQPEAPLQPISPLPSEPEEESSISSSVEPDIPTQTETPSPSTEDSVISAVTEPELTLPSTTLHSPTAPIPQEELPNEPSSDTPVSVATEPELSKPITPTTPDIITEHYIQTTPSTEELTAESEDTTESTCDETDLPQGEFELCPCAQGEALMQIIDNKSIINLLTDEKLQLKLENLILPVEKYANKTRKLVLEAVLTEIMLKDHEVHAAIMSCMDDGSDYPPVITSCIPTQYALDYPEDVLLCPSMHVNPTNPRVNECPCPEGHQYLQVIDNSNLSDQLSRNDAHLQDRILSLTLPVAKYANRNRKETLESVLKDILLDYEVPGVMKRLRGTGEDIPRIVNTCVPKDYAEMFPMDIINCPEISTQTTTKPHSECSHPVDVMVPSSLLEAIDPEIVKNSTDMVQVIENSSLEKIKYEYLGSKANIMQELLREMKEVAEAKYKAIVGETMDDLRKKVKHWIQQLDDLSSGIRHEGQGEETPKIMNTCVDKTVECSSWLCGVGAVQEEEHTMLESALRAATTNAEATTPNPMGKRKVKKTHIIYTTKETINVTIQATKATNEASPDEDISKITDIMAEEQKHSEERIADQVSFNNLTENDRKIIQALSLDNSWSLSVVWPLLLKPLPETSCWDPVSESITHIIQVVNVTELLQGADGTPAQIYIASAKLASAETYKKLSTFDLVAYHTKTDFTRALTSHLNTTLPVEQCSTTPISITNACNRDLYDTLPDFGLRRKRHTHEDLEEARKLNDAFKTGSKLLLNMTQNF